MMKLKDLFGICGIFFLSWKKVFIRSGVMGPALFINKLFNYLENSPCQNP